MAAWVRTGDCRRFRQPGLLSNGLLSFDGDVSLHMGQSLSLYAGGCGLSETAAGTHGSI